jgi:hypothetical protein
MKRSLAMVEYNYDCRAGSSGAEQRPFKPRVVGSNPTRLTTLLLQHPLPSETARTVIRLRISDGMDGTRFGIFLQ